MGFWKTYRQVWNVRTSIWLQQGLENLFGRWVDGLVTKWNSKDILNEYIRKNSQWKNKLDGKRKETEY
ncbi:MAG: hypothetical protein ACKOWQ_01250 [Aquirufa sp.]